MVIALSSKFGLCLYSSVILWFMAIQLSNELRVLLAV